MRLFVLALAGCLAFANAGFGQITPAHTEVRVRGDGKLICELLLVCELSFNSLVWLDDCNAFSKLLSHALKTFFHKFLLMDKNATRGKRFGQDAAQALVSLGIAMPSSNELRAFASYVPPGFFFPTLFAARNVTISVLRTRRAARTLK